jgi:hypothetical protein
MMRAWGFAVLLFCCTAWGQADLLAVVRHGTLEEVQAALVDGDLEATTSDGLTPLMLAVRHNTPEVARLLMAAGADTTKLNEWTGRSLYAYAHWNLQADEMHRTLRDAGVIICVGPACPGRWQPTTPQTTQQVSASACVDINTASLEELRQIRQIDLDRGAQIIRLRPFASVDQLTRVSGIGAQRLSQIKAQGLACVR